MSAESPSFLDRVVFGRNPRMTLLRVLFVVVRSYVLFGFVLVPVRVTGISMEPTYHDGRVNFVNRLSYRSDRWVQRGDVIGIQSHSERALYLKRVIALPGERVSIRAGVVHIDGKPLAEPYTKPNPGWFMPPVQVSTNEVFVIGDNRTMGIREHSFGLVNRADVVGRILY